MHCNNESAVSPSSLYVERRKEKWEEYSRIFIAELEQIFPQSCCALCGFGQMWQIDHVDPRMRERQPNVNIVFDPHWYIPPWEWYLWSHNCSKPPLSVIEEPGNEWYCYCVKFNERVLKDEKPSKQPGPAEKRVWSRSTSQCVCVWINTWFSTAP